MSRVASFEFYDDPVQGTGGSICTINWATQTIVYPGVASVGFGQCDELVAVIEQLATQNEADNIIESAKQITGGASDLTVTYNKNANPRTVSPGASAFSVTKAMDLASGIQQFLLDEINP